MLTTLDIITGALRKIGEYAPGETLSAADSTDALSTLNGLLDMWSNEHLAVYANIENVLAWTAGKGSYTVGSGGDFNIIRPLKITSMYSRLTATGSSIDMPCELVAAPKYMSIGMKNQPGPWPKLAYYDMQYPLATLYVWPVPTAPYEFHLWTDQTFADVGLNDTFSMPQGYFLALQYNLAVLLAPEYGIEPPPTVLRLAKSMKATLKATNANPTREAPIDAAGLGSGPAHDAGFILTGGF
jgi:hypothetical protein